jgi:hypothetical protein
MLVSVKIFLSPLNQHLALKHSHPLGRNVTKFVSIIHVLTILHTVRSHECPYQGGSLAIYLRSQGVFSACTAR